MIATLLILCGAVFGVLGVLHTIYTLLDLRNPRRLAPVDPSVAHAMAQLPGVVGCGRHRHCRSAEADAAYGHQNHDEPLR
jgi:hypothetical protein